MQCVDHIIEVLDLAGCQDTSEYDGARRKAEGSMSARDIFRRRGHAISNREPKIPPFHRNSLYSLRAAVVKSVRAYTRPRDVNNGGSRRRRYSADLIPRSTELHRVVLT